MLPLRPPPIHLAWDASGAFEKAIPPVPFFSRLGVKSAVIFSALIVLAMTGILAQQLHHALDDIRRNAVGNGQALAASVAPLLGSDLQQSTSTIQGYLNNLVSGGGFAYAQIVDAQGRVEWSGGLSSNRLPPSDLSGDWLQGFSAPRFDLQPSLRMWPDRAGADIFVALAGASPLESPAQFQSARHLRLGLDFGLVLQREAPRRVGQIVQVTLQIALIIILGLLLMLKYLLSPLCELLLGVRAVAAGNLRYQVPVYSRDEMGRLGIAFNAMAERLEDAFSQIEALASHDALTSLANRRVFDGQLAYELARSRRYGHNFGLIIFDLDFFKMVNDRFGHPAGDAVLLKVAELVRAHVRETDLAARIGGEEFAVILPETSEEEVLAVAEKLRTSIAASETRAPSGSHQVIGITASFGATCSGAGPMSAAEIVGCADAALYRSKHAGRNRVTMA